jgi:hypothetical protein
VLFLGDISFVKIFLTKLSCYHDNYFKYFMFGKLNGFVSKGRGFCMPISLPGSFHYAPRWRKDPCPGWSRVSQILGDNNIFT